MSVYSIDRLMTETRRLAAEHRRAFGRPLAVSGELARYDASRLLDLELVESPDAGFDALGRGAREGKRILVKGRAIFGDSRGGERLGQINLQAGWDLLLVVLMDDAFEPGEIWELDRELAVAAVNDAADSKRARRGALSVARIRAIGRLAWSRDPHSGAACTGD